MAQKRKASLSEELSWYESNKHEWLGSHQGEFVLINEKQVAGFFPSYEKALEAGLRTFGVLNDFLIKQVVEQEPVFVIY
jgi:hypothetical protein